MNPFIRAAIGGGVATGLALVAVPVTVWTLGFTAAGISAGSIAAKMMSAAAIANGGGVAAGSTVAVLQSLGMDGKAQKRRETAQPLLRDRHWDRIAHPRPPQR
ncbi:hypothetical protein CIB84_001238 [Bambusicola thoracicus]|uniref:Uncharacterized protein n=1 Tax=Bambusicola thoracicus TaxID=9083 RepID=A0A2P4TF66_BAMTH|nr:hypothetical protein CIB84_001238 [Bambusicola thoracicus]